MRASTIVFLALLLAPVCGVAGAEERPGSVARILDQQQEIRAGVLQQSGRYEDMPAVKRDAIIAEQDKVFVLLEVVRLQSTIRTTSALSASG